LEGPPRVNADELLVERCAAMEMKQPMVRSARQMVAADVAAAVGTTGKQSETGK
jgi:hypothetical protein